MAKAEALSWKDKYLLSLENLEDAQLQAEKRLDLLRKGFVRVSLAADGLDDSLDSVLSELRMSLRKNDDVMSLEPMITRLEKCVVALDDHRKEDHSSAVDMIDSALAAAQEVGLSRRDKSTIKSFRKQLPEMLTGASVNIELWKTFLDVQGPVFSHVKALEDGDKAQKGKGLFKKLFSSSETSDDNEVVTESTVPDVEEPDRSIVQENEIELNSSVDDVSESNALQADSDEEDEEDLFKEELKSRTVQVFCGLVDQIETPDEFDIRKDKLVERLQNNFDWPLLPDLLNEAMELVASTRQVAQQEFEGFLITLHDRLQDIQDFLKVAREGEVQAQLNQSKLDEEVRSGLKDIKASVDEAMDIGILKADITSMVNQIVEVIDSFHLDEKDRRGEVYDRIELLGAKMLAMEAEATELRNNLEAQRLQAMRDPLTELPNRQAYDEQIEKEFSRWKRHQRSLSLAIVDIDFFKKVNDNLGHLRGDKVLKLVSRAVQTNIRNEDFVARYGGEEFVILMPDTDEESAMAAIEKVRAAVENCPFNFAGERVTITASFGVSGFKGSDEVTDCFDRADKALYRAKEQGRNRVERG
ncbi:hypothetical protein A9Q99_15115 [Gammaproteobacteria bacterium 45_16_T64]|nr:hypothetical protein A9Q99_15115 [Gammaproteobacteria bacterium 45_16_T64]